MVVIRVIMEANQNGNYDYKMTLSVGILRFVDKNSVRDGLHKKDKSLSVVQMFRRKRPVKFTLGAVSC